MSVVATVTYPNDNPSAKFNMDYYLGTHMPLVAKHWAKYGLKEWRVVQYSKGLGGSGPVSRVLAILYFDSMDNIKAATEGEEAKTVFGDVPNFTDISPVFVAGDQVGTAMV